MHKAKGRLRDQSMLHNGKSSVKVVAAALVKAMRAEGFENAYVVTGRESLHLMFSPMTGSEAGLIRAMEASGWRKQTEGLFPCVSGMKAVYHLETKDPVYKTSVMVAQLRPDTGRCDGWIFQHSSVAH